jgi:hypothetical protein
MIPQYQNPHTSGPLGPGKIYRTLKGEEINTSRAASIVKFGRAVQRASNAEECEHYTSASGEFLGVAVRDVLVNIDGQYAAGDPVGVANYAVPVVEVSEAVSLGDPVRIRHGTSASAGYQEWGFTAPITGGGSTGLSADTTATAGRQDVDLGASKSGGDATGLANDTTTYGMIVVLDGAAHEVSVVGSAAQTYTLLLAEINTDLTSDGTASLSGGDLRITSDTTGAASSVAITDGNDSTDEDLLATLEASFAIQAAVAGADAAAVTYGAVVVLDGVAHEVSVDGSDAQTFTTLATQITTDLSSNGTCTVADGALLITSATTGATSTVAITDGNDSTDNDLFGSLTNSNANPETAVAGVAAEDTAGTFCTTAEANKTTLLAGARFEGATSGSGFAPVYLPPFRTLTADT